MQTRKTVSKLIGVANRLESPPLVAQEVNLESFPWAPVRLDFLGNHPLILTESAEPFRSLVLLMVKAWRQRPAMSLPNDDVQLAAWAGFGRDVPQWLKIRDQVLQGFVLATDDRWHHEEFADWANQAWDRKLQADRFSGIQRERAQKGAALRRSAVSAATSSSHGTAAAQPYKKEQEKDIDSKGSERGEESELSSHSHSPSAVCSLIDDSATDSNHLERSEEVIQEVIEVDPVEVIFEHWKARTERHSEKLSSDRRNVILARLKDGLTVRLICLAIDAAASDDFYQGRTEKSNRRMDWLDVICKSKDRVLSLASSTGNKARSATLESHATRATVENFMDVFDDDVPDALDLEADDVPLLGKEAP